jgi:pimeloyl-ACP methyl ester carboxylesterase/DNA-binding CsgD family transcriptional regulator
MGPGRETAGATPVQDIRFCRSADGTGIAYAVHGSGPPLVIDACWLSHLQFDWQSPVWRHWLVELGRIATVIRFDERGHGLSDRDVTDHSLEARIADLEAVVDHAGLDRFALLAMAQGGPISIEYAVRHPARVSRLIFHNSYAGALADATPEEIELDATFDSLIKVGWERPTPEFRRVFTSLMIPDATEKQMSWLDELQRMAVDADTAVVARAQRKSADARHLLPLLDVPTLVLQCRGDQMTSFAQARYLAAHIEGAAFVALDSKNHILLADEPAWPDFVREVDAFLEDDRAALPAPAPDGAPVAGLLSARELDVLRAAARGHDNDEIAATLHLSVRTVERHLQNVYAKLGLQGRTARTAAVARLLAGA